MKNLTEAEARELLQVSNARIYGTIASGIYNGQIIKITPKRLEEFKGNLKDIYTKTDAELMQGYITKA